MSMFKEYALDPGLITSVDKCVKFLNLFGLKQGKQLSNFPRRWIRTITTSPKYLELDDNDKKNIEIILMSIPSEVFVNRDTRYNERSVWIENALSEHKRENFDGIITINDHDYEKVFSENDINLNHEDLKTSPSVSMENDAKKMAEWIKPLIQNASVILFIDNFFKPYSDTFKEPLKLYADIINNSPIRSTWIELQFHLGVDVVPNRWADNPKEWLIKEVKKHIENILPENSISKFFLWKSGELHDRFILTQEFGGIEYGHSWGTISKDKKIQNMNYVEKDGSIYQKNWESIYDSNKDAILTLTIKQKV